MQLAYYGDPVLRRKADPIDNISSELKEIIPQMIEFMYDNDGGGLAAPQIKVSQRFFIIDLYLYEEEHNRSTTEKLSARDPSRVTVFINPKLSNPSMEYCFEMEGCLSVPGLRVPVVRPTAITVEAMDLKGNIFSKTLTGYQARSVMHENDHLNGVLHIDRASQKDRKKLEKELQLIKKKYYLMNKSEGK
ncbi:MAG: def [Chlamydiales bacterium]|nr:def [Chlamydiales bacterium]